MAEALTNVMERFPGGQRINTILIGAAALAVIWGLAQWGMEPRFVPVATGLPVERIGEATQRLDEAGIQYRLERAGSMVTVPDREAARARVALAADGLTGDAAAPGFELFDQPSWGMTDFTQRVNYRRALEGELERTMSRMRGVESARVHLALEERSFLRSQAQAGEASVVLGLLGGNPPDESVVSGVQSLVASAVEGLAPENVTVLDDRGRLLSEGAAETGVSLTSAQLKVQTELERHLEQKAESVVAQIVGLGNATVRVAAELNFDQVDRTVQAVDPNQSTLVTEERAEIIPGNEAQGAGSLQTSTEFETTRSVETTSRGGARVERLTVAVVVSDRRMDGPDGAPAFEPRTAAELRQIEALVGNAVGLSSTRGDQISVMSAPLEGAPATLIAAEEEGFDYAGIAMAAQRPLVAFVALTLAFLLVLRILKSLSPGPMAPRAGSGGDQLPTSATEPRLAAAAQGAPAPALSAPEAPTAAAPAPPRPQIQDPGMTAKVLRSWIREG